MNAILKVEGLKVEFEHPLGAVKAVDDVSFALLPGERLGLAGESGSGKSTMALSILRMIKPPGRITGGRLVIDYGARNKNAGIIANWKRSYGADSVRYVVNHAKIATIQTDRYRLLLRGSMNLNMNPRFEQFDLTEGGPDFDLVKEVEDELPVLPDDCTGADAYKASKVADAFNPEQLSLFTGVKVWAK
jgi:energy-coupling factor transporter ATP-binding protein EcfA2